jgi:ketosteroid isomerase-like protein
MITVTPLDRESARCCATNVDYIGNDTFRHLFDSASSTPVRIDGKARTEIEYVTILVLRSCPMAENTASAPSTLPLNDPRIVKEIEAEFAGYDDALRNNDVAALNRYFFDSPTTTRFGNAENLYGHGEISSYRAGSVPTADAKRERTVIATYGSDFATVATLSRRPNATKVGRTLQTWVRFPQGWRIVAAHVSTIDNTH